MAMHSWTAGDQVNAADLNGNFDLVTKNTYTASGAISANDVVYPSANDTVKTIYPSAQETGTSVSTNPSHSQASRSFPLSGGGKFLYIIGATEDLSAPLYAQVRTMNAGETNFTNGSEQTVYSTGDGVRSFEACQIDTDKFLIIFQAMASGSAAGIKCVVITVSGTTVTVGSVVTLETTGNSAKKLLGCAKVDTNKVLLSYNKDSNDDLYCQVATVSGTTITTNTEVVIKVGSNFDHAACQLATNSCMVVFSQASTNTIKGVVISVSGTTPTVNSEQTLYTDANNDNYYFTLRGISSTKALIVYSQRGNNLYDTANVLTVSGSTITAGGSPLSLGSAHMTYMRGVHLFGSKYALVSVMVNATSGTLYFIDVSSTSPTSISNQGLSVNSISYRSTDVVKVSPWTYCVQLGEGSAGRYIVKMTPVSTGFIGIAAAAIANAATGAILRRFENQTLSGFTVTAGSKYYVDDDGQPTTQSSLTSPALGIGFNATSMLLT